MNWLVCIPLILILAFPLVSRGEEGKAYPANLELVQRAAKAASEKVAGQLPTATRALVLRGESPRPLDWAVEEALTGALIRAGFQVFKSSLEGDSSAALSYQTVDLGISYQDKPGGVERAARVRIAYSLTRGNAGRILNSGDGLGTARDLVPPSLLPGLETPEIVPARLPAGESLSSRLLEPALLTAVVAGLIYLFYGSKAAK